MKKFDDDLEFESLNDEPRDTRFILPIIVVAVLLVIVIVALVLLGKNKDTSADLMSTEQSETTETETQTTEVIGNIATTESTEEVEADDPQNGNMGTDTGASVDVTALLSAGSVAESGETTFGIDVARYQGTIDWSQVAASGVQFAMIRVGYRTQKTGEIVADTNAKYNIAGSAGKRDKNRGILLFNSSDGRRSCTGSGLGGRLYFPVSDHLSGCI